MSKELNTFIDESKEIIDKLNKHEDLIGQSTPESFRSTLLGFMESQMKTVQKSTGLLGLVDSALVEKIATKEMSTDDLLHLRNSLMQAGTQRLSAILEPFKATNTSPSSLIPPPSMESDNSKSVTDSLSGTERQALNKLALILEGIEKKQKEEKSSEDSLGIQEVLP